MKTFALGTPLLFATLMGSITAQDEKDIYTKFSVVGEWNVTHPYWTDVMTFREDGTFSVTDQSNSGRWVLTADAGTPLLVLRWDRWGTESLLMINQKHFRGQIQPGSFMDMRRGEEAAQ